MLCHVRVYGAISDTSGSGKTAIHRELLEPLSDGHFILFRRYGFSVILGREISLEECHSVWFDTLGSAHQGCSFLQRAMTNGRTVD